MCMLAKRKMNTKVCGKCKELKTLDGFNKKKPSKDGYQSKCKACEKNYKVEYRAANPEKIKESQAKWCAANPEKVKEQQAKYCAANSEKRKEYSAEYRAANPEKVKDRKAKYYAANPEKGKKYSAEYRAANPDYDAEYYAANSKKRKEYAAKYQKANPEKCRAKESNRRAAKLEAIPSWLTEEDWQSIDAINKEADRLELETGIKHHVDHIHPLQGKLVCGLHCPTNLQILTAAENCSKGNKFTPYVESELTLRTIYSGSKYI